MPNLCEECGYQLEDNMQVCPKCGCPIKNASASVYMDNNILNKGMSTEAESIISEVAEIVLKWGNILAIIVPIFIILNCLITGAMQLENNNGIGFFTIIVGIITAVVYYFVIKLVAKIIWGVIMLFVNISTTLKRIELKLEGNGTN
ncbi:MAG: hypothetical protein HUJ68_09010 [Clostridia bacterium]|nr:hypothetical protein [Clostridia bacterium]